MTSYILESGLESLFLALVVSRLVSGLLSIGEALALTLQGRGH